MLAIPEFSCTIVAKFRGAIRCRRDTNGRVVDIYWPPGEGYGPTGSFLAPCAAHQV
jgi:hypothetical protein